MSATLAMSMPDSRQLKDLFRPFDRRFNKEKFHVKIKDKSRFRAASVLVPLFYKDGELRVLLTVRSKDMPSHAGHVAFPGGMSDPGDTDAIETALREAEEEVGIQRKDVEVIAVLTGNIVGWNSLVTPVVGILASDLKLNINPREVEMVFDLPLKRFLSLEGRTEENVKYKGKFEYNLYHFRDTVNSRELDTWGYTAVICIQAAMVVFQSDLKVWFSKGVAVSKENCFTAKTTQALIESMEVEPKL